jgi:hypothetical protein
MLCFFNKDIFYGRLTFLLYILKLCMTMAPKLMFGHKGIKLLWTASEFFCRPTCAEAICVSSLSLWLTVCASVQLKLYNVSMNMFICKCWLLALRSYCDYCIRNFLIYRNLYRFYEKCRVLCCKVLLKEKCIRSLYAELLENQRGNP